MADQDASAETPSSSNSAPRNSRGWDGKLRVGPRGSQDGPNVPTPPESENEDENNRDETVSGEQIDADEDLLEDLPRDETDIDLNHCRITSIPALHLERFQHVERLCLRQNQISHIKFPDDWGSSVEELDLYDNSISHVKGFENFPNVTSLDLSFNGIKHIKKVNHLKKLRDLFFVQNKITKIEELEGLSELKNLELGANRIRDIENLDSLSNLQELWLGKNKITELKNLTPLTNLTLLSIQSNRLTSESLSHLSTLPQLSELYISFNAIDSIASLSQCKKLTTIDVSSNPLKSIEGLQPLDELEEFWASDCQLENFEELERELGGKQTLQTVYFEGNPMQRRQPALYRNKVRLALPQVKQIDATFIRVD